MPTPTTALAAYICSGRLANGYFVNGYFEFPCARKTTHVRELVGRLFLPEGSSLFPPFLSLNWRPSRDFSRILQVPVCKVLLMFLRLLISQTEVFLSGTTFCANMRMLVCLQDLRRLHPKFFDGWSWQGHVAKHVPLKGWPFHQFTAMDLPQDRRLQLHIGQLFPAQFVDGCLNYLDDGIRARRTSGHCSYR